MLETAQYIDYLEVQDMSCIEKIIAENGFAINRASVVFSESINKAGVYTLNVCIPYVPK